MFCGKCGCKVPDGYEYCMKCGTKIDLENSEVDTLQTPELSNQGQSNKKKLSKRNKLLFFGSISLVVMICFTMGYFVLSRDKYHIDFPKNPEFKVGVASLITAKNQPIINTFLEELVTAFNNREDGNDGLLYDESGSLKEGFDLLAQQRNMASSDYKEQIQPALNAYALLLYYELEEVQKYDKDFNKVDNPIVSDSTLIKAKEKIEETLSYYFDY